MAKDKRSRDQKRKAKLAKRARKQGASRSVEPYEGRKYQQPQSTALIYATELAIFEVIQLTDRRRGNASRRAAAGPGDRLRGAAADVEHSQPLDALL
jgi:hypothetical protein